METRKDLLAKYKKLEQRLTNQRQAVDLQLQRMLQALQMRNKDAQGATLDAIVGFAVQAKEDLDIMMQLCDEFQEQHLGRPAAKAKPEASAEDDKGPKEE